MKPEETARQQIDRQLDEAGWIVQDHRQMNLSAGPGVAVREFPLKTGSADYLLYLQGRAVRREPAEAHVVGVIEAKPAGHTLTGVEIQSAKYTSGLPDVIPHYRLPLPFAYETTGEETRFTNSLEPDFRSRPVFTFHRPEELARLVGLGDEQLRARLRALPELVEGNLWRVQVDAIRGLERSLANNRPRSLIQMATGSGKTYAGGGLRVEGPGMR